MDVLFGCQNCNEQPDSSKAAERGEVRIQSGRFVADLEQPRCPWRLFSLGGLMATVKIYGRSDDCIEVDGDVREEFYAYHVPKFLHFDDGTVARVEFSPKGHEGRWRIDVSPSLHTNFNIERPADDGVNYTDVLTLNGNISSVECWESVDGPSEGELIQFFMDLDANDWGGLKLDKLRRMYAIFKE